MNACKPGDTGLVSAANACHRQRAQSSTHADLSPSNSLLLSPSNLLPCSPDQTHRPAAVNLPPLTARLAHALSVGDKKRAFLPSVDDKIKARPQTRKLCSLHSEPTTTAAQRCLSKPARCCVLLLWAMLAPTPTAAVMDSRPDSNVHPAVPHSARQ